MDVIRELPEIFEELAQKKQQSFLTVKEYKDKGIPVIGRTAPIFRGNLLWRWGQFQSAFVLPPMKRLK